MTGAPSESTRGAPALNVADEDFVQEQTELWDAMQEETVNEAVG